MDDWESRLIQYQPLQNPMNYELSTSGLLYQFSTNRNPQFGVWLRGSLYSVETVQLWYSLAMENHNSETAQYCYSSIMIQPNCGAALGQGSPMCWSSAHLWWDSSSPVCFGPGIDTGQLNSGLVGQLHCYNSAGEMQCLVETKTALPEPEGTWLGSYQPLSLIGPLSWKWVLQILIAWTVQKAVSWLVRM